MARAVTALQLSPGNRLEGSCPRLICQLLASFFSLTSVSFSTFAKCCQSSRLGYDKN